MRKRKTIQILFLFLLISISSFMKIQSVNAISEDLNYTYDINADSFYEDFYVGNATTTYNERTYERDARINFGGYANGFEVFGNDMINTSNYFDIIDSTDYDLDGNDFITNMAYIPSKERVEIGFNSSNPLDMDEEVLQFSVVFKIENQTAQYGGYTDDEDFPFVFNVVNNDTDKIRAYFSYNQVQDKFGFYTNFKWFGGNNYEHYYMDNADFNISKPVYVGIEVRQESLYCEFGNVDGKLHEVFNELNLPDPIDFVQNITLGFNNTGNFDFGGISAIDFNQNYTINNKYYEKDSSFYLKRILTVYETNDETFNYHDYDAISKFNNTEVDYYNISDSNQYFDRDLSFNPVSEWNEDYKLDLDLNQKDGVEDWGNVSDGIFNKYDYKKEDRDGLLNKTGVEQWGTTNNSYLTTWSDNDGILSVQHKYNHQNVLKSTWVVGTQISQKLWSAQVSGTIEFYISGDSIQNFYIRDNANSVCIRIKMLSDTSLQIYHGDGVNPNTAITVNYLEFAHIKFTFDCITDTFSAWSDGVSILTDKTFYNDESSTTLDYLQNYMTSAGSIWLDAIGFSWNGYLSNDNRQIEDWLDLSNSYCSISSNDLDSHESVMNLTDDSNSGLTQIIKSFDEESQGYFEFWYQVSDSTNADNYFSIFDGSTSNGIFLRIDNGDIKSYDGVSYNQISAFNNDEWIHFSIEYDCSSGFNIYINSILIGNYNFRGTPLKMDGFVMFTASSDSNYNVFYDAIGFSCNNYTLGSNKYIGALEERPKFMRSVNLTCNGAVDDEIKLYNLFDIDFSYYSVFDPFGSGQLEIKTKYYESNSSYLGVIFTDDDNTTVSHVSFDLEDINGHKNSIEMKNTPSGTTIIFRYFDYYDENYYYHSNFIPNFYSNDDVKNYNDYQGFLVQRINDESITILYFNATNYYTLKYDYRLSFAHDISLNIESEGAESLHILGIVNDETPIQNYWYLFEDKMILSNEVRTSSYSLTEPTSSIYIYDMCYLYKVGGFIYKSNDTDLYLDYWGNITELDYYSVKINSTTYMNDKLLFTNDDYDVSGNTSDTFELLHGIYDLDVVFNVSMYRDSDSYITLRFKAVSYWICYYGIAEHNILNKMMNLATPLLVLFIFPFAFNKKFGMIGGMIGLLLGLGVMAYSQMIPLLYVIILAPISLILLYMVNRYKKGDDI